MENDKLKKIEDKVKSWTFKNISKDFKFREHQLECIVRIIDNITSHKYASYVVEAPTGSGKSLINMISAGVLAEYYGMTSYILVSDLFLWDQYEKFLKSHQKTGIASLKGQIGNYVCDMNGEDISNADCKMCGISWASLFNASTIAKYGYDCAWHCEYLNARKKAIKASVCVMTYQLFMFVMSSQKTQDENKGMPTFMPHDIIFCDECHNIPEIVQLQYSPTIIEDHFLRLQEIYQYEWHMMSSLFEEKEEGNDNIYDEYPTWQKLEKDIQKLWKVWTSEYTNQHDDLEALKTYVDILSKFGDLAENIKTEVQNAKQDKQLLSKDQKHMFKLATWFESMYGHLQDLLACIDIAGEKYLLRDNQVSSTTDHHMIVSFKCTKEDLMTYKCLLSKAPYKVMTSATVGTKESFCERVGFKYEKKSDFEETDIIVDEPYIDRLPSTFDFSKSPIWFLDKFKMSYRERNVSFEYLKKAIYSICKTKFKDQKGMIQTGSYYFAKKLYDDASPELKQRMLVYNGSREKVSIVKLHQIASDTILVGPTLNTGIDLPGDDCRFIIILKVPYPSLGDKLANARMKLYPLWYESHTSSEIIQGIGRGVRYDGDWCVTYILDACFKQLYASTKDQYSKELQERIKTI